MNRAKLTQVFEQNSNLEDQLVRGSRRRRQVLAVTCASRRQLRTQVLTVKVRVACVGKSVRGELSARVIRQYQVVKLSTVNIVLCNVYILIRKL